MQKKWISALVLLVVLGMLGGLFAAARPAAEPQAGAAEYMEYENAVVEQILSDSTETDPVSENHYRGGQTLIVRVKTGRYAGEQMMADNTVGPIYGRPMEVGDGITVGLSTYADGTVRCYVYEYNRFPGLLIVLGAFLLVTVLVGGRVGVKSLVSLGLTVAALIFVLLPLLLRGWPTIPTTFLVSVLVTAATFVILGGVDKRRSARAWAPWRASPWPPCSACWRSTSWPLTAIARSTPRRCCSCARPGRAPSASRVWWWRASSSAHWAR